MGDFLEGSHPLVPSDPGNILPLCLFGGYGDWGDWHEESEWLYPAGKFETSWTNSEVLIVLPYFIIPYFTQGLFLFQGTF
jgi:hypothetical protein